jgi:predicted ATPase
MLTRLKVNGFKNLVDVDVRFGPFTCIAGANGVGKSNLFDAIRFLSALADKPLVEAALSVRDEGTSAADVQSIFHKVGNEYAKEMSFVAEMIIPAQGENDLGKVIHTNATYLQYSIGLAYRKSSVRNPGGVELVREELVQIFPDRTGLETLFPHSPAWRQTAIFEVPIQPLPLLTVEMFHSSLALGALGLVALLPTSTNESRTGLSFLKTVDRPLLDLVRQEMHSWRLLQLEPSALRRPDEWIAPSNIAANGAHLPATLNRLAHSTNGKRTTKAMSAQVYSGIANRLYQLLGEVREVEIDRDVKRELLTLLVKGKDGTALPARALSDGTLRFLALAILEADPQAQGLFCLEEPENGIHPERIPAMIQLLRDIATDPTLPLGDDNPLRQVIINTHSPAIVAQVPDDSLLIAQTEETSRGKKRFKRAVFHCLPDTWRDDGHPTAINRGALLAYLNPVTRRPFSNGTHKRRVPERRVIDREDLAALIPGAAQKNKSPKSR